MPLFGRSSRRRGHSAHSDMTNDTMTDSVYNNGVNNHGMTNHGTTNHEMTNHGVNDHRGVNDRRGTTGHQKSSRLGRRDRRQDRYDEKPRHSKAKRQKRPLFDINSGYYNRRPSFGTWLKYTWLDILTMIAMGAVGLGVYMADPAPSRSFPVTFSDGTIVYPQFAYPLRNEIIPIWAAALLAALVPIVVFLFMQIRIKSFWDVNNAVIGLLYSLIGAAVFQVFVKWCIGGLRPHFLDVCRPDPARLALGGEGYGSIMFKSDICTGDRNQINDSLESMPSGHSTAAWAGFLYLYFYLNAKLKVFSNHHPAMWKLIALYAPLLGATLITGALTIDEFHNWYDCLAGALIGSVFAISAYRMVYASVWDFRFNHIPLTRHTPFSYGAGAAGAGGFESAVFTHKAGWGYEEAYGGAPFDSALALRGMGAGTMGRDEHTFGLGDKNMGHRPGDVEHNAVGTGTGIGTGTGTTTGGMLGPHRDNNRTDNLGRDNNLDHDRNRGHGLFNRHDREPVNDPYNSYNTTNTNTNTNTAPGVTQPMTAHGGTTTTHSGGFLSHDDVDREGRPLTTGDNRYRSHRKSLERKAIANNNNNNAVRNEPAY